MEQATRDKIAKVLELINRGATDGEKQAAKKALDRLMKRHHLDEAAIKSIDIKEYYFNYSSLLEKYLLKQLIYMLVGVEVEVWRSSWTKNLIVKLTPIQYITIECNYEYFRRHMKKQWQLVCGPELKKCRKAATRNKRRAELYLIFFNQYTIKSNLYKEGDLEQVDYSKLKNADIENLLLVSDIEGGQYKKQVGAVHLLEN